MKKLNFMLFLLFAVGCSQLTLEPSDFSWPIETVLDVDENGNINENRYSFSTNVKSLFLAETNDSTAYINASVRIIRDEKGLYYITSNGFKNVYLFTVSDGKMALYSKYLVSEFGLDLPAFNQRKPYIEVLDGEEHILFLNSDGLKGEE